MEKNLIAVLTADVVNSRSMNASRWLDPLKKVLDRYGKSPVDWEIRRGDEIQMVMKAPQHSLYATMELKAVLKSFSGMDLRVAIGIGTETHDADTVSQSNGEAFIRSGNVFDRIKSGGAAIEIASPWPGFDADMNLYLRLAIIAMEGWSPKVSSYIQYSLEHPDEKQEIVAKQLGISQSAVSRRKQRANYDVLTDLQVKYRNAVEELMKR